MIKKIIIYFSTFVVLFLLIAGIVGYFVISTTFDDLCGSHIITISVSPNEKKKIILYERSCGATTGFTTQISILPTNEELKNEFGNLYGSSGYPKDINFKWVSNSIIEISGIKKHSKNLVKSYDGIEIQYK